MTIATLVLRAQIAHFRSWIVAFFRPSLWQDSWNFISYRMQHKILECWKVSAPAAVLRPGSSNDIASIISAIYGCKSDLTISARGAGDSINGQDQALDGIVVEMTGIKLRD